MRFREKWIKDKNKYILWVDTYALFPYDYESVDVYISLWNKNASEVRYLPAEKLSVTEHRMHWLSGSEKDMQKQTPGIQIGFDAPEDIEEVVTIGIIWLFSYHNEQGEYNRHVLYTLESVRFELQEKWAYADYVIEKRCTPIPGILESDKSQIRCDIINGYEEVIRACAAVQSSALRSNGGREQLQAAQFYAERVKSERGISPDEAYDISVAAFEHMKKKEIIKNHCDNVYMCILVNQTTRLLRPHGS